MALGNNSGLTEEEIKRAREYVELREKARTSLLEYKEIMEHLAKIKATERHYAKELKKYAEKDKQLAAERVKHEIELNKAVHKRNAAEMAHWQDKIDALDEERTILDNNAKFAQQEIKRTQQLGKLLAENLNTNNLIHATYGSTLKTLGAIGKTLYEQKGYLLEQQKALKMSELQMGLLSKESQGYRDNLFNASLSTNQLGVDSKALSDMQATYSQEIGRTVILTEAGNQAMAELAMGTTLGTENAAQFAANMEMLGHSVEASRDFMEDTLNIAHKMGLNSAASAENLNKALELANRYNFADGVKGIQRMALVATRLRLDIGAIEGIADKAFNPEGAIEMAANLSVLGGEWAKLGDPFSLMFKSRTDLAGLTEDIAAAAASGAEFNAETGEFDIASMQLHRLKEVANATGMELSDLTKAARNAAKFSKIKAEVTGDFDDDILEFISSKGRFDAKTGEFKVNINGQDEFVKNLNKFTKAEMRALVDEQANLKERAIQAQTFDEQWNNILNQFKSTLLPGFDRFSKAVLEGLTDFSNWIQEEGVLEGISTFGKQVGEIAGAMVKFAANNPWMTLIGLMVGKAASWVMRGRLLGLGFNMTAKGAANAVTNGAFGAGGPATMLGRGGKIDTLGRGPLGKLGAIGAVGKMAYNGFQNGTDDNLSTGDAILKTLDQNKGAIIGAALGLIGGPGGAMLGAGIGSMADSMLPTFGNWDAQPAQGAGNSVANDFIARPGQEPMKFSSADTLIGMKAGGGIDNFMKKSEKSGSNSDRITVNFSQPLKIEGKISLTANGQTGAIDLNNPILMRELSRMVQEEITVTLNGKRNANPAA